MQLEMAVSDAVVPAQAEAVGDAETNHEAQHATAGPKAEASHAMQLEMGPTGRAAARPVTKLEIGAAPSRQGWLALKRSEVSGESAPVVNAEIESAARARAEEVRRC